MTDATPRARAEEVTTTYLFRYEHAGRTWGFDLQAKSIGDARERLAKLAFARYDGMLIETIPVENYQGEVQ